MEIKRQYFFHRTATPDFLSALPVTLPRPEPSFPLHFPVDSLAYSPNVHSRKVSRAEASTRVLTPILPFAQLTVLHFSSSLLADVINTHPSACQIRFKIAPRLQILHEVKYYRVMGLILLLMTEKSNFLEYAYFLYIFKTLMYFIFFKVVLMQIH